MTAPFLTIFTRCCDRPSALTQNIQSVKAQTCNDIEQIFAIDYKRTGMVNANRQFWRYRHIPTGQYVFHLDDDGQLQDTDFVASVKQCAEESDYPDVVLCRQIQSKPQWRHLPPASVWGLDWDNGERPKKWIGSGYCYVVKTELWRPNTTRYFPGEDEHWRTGGDWHFMTALLELNVAVKKVNAISAIGSRSGGKFESVRKGWFESVALQFDLEQRERYLWVKYY